MKTVFIVGVLLAVLGCAAQQPKETPQYPIQMELKGDTPFAPEVIGSFKREAFFLVKEGTSDNAVTYRLKAPPKLAVAQRFLYEAESAGPESLEREFRNVKLVLENLQKNSSLIAEEPVSFERSGEVRAGYWSLHGIKSHPNDTAFSNHTETDVFQVKDKFIKFRISYPADQHEALQEDIRNLVNTLVWVEIS